MIKDFVYKFLGKLDGHGLRKTLEHSHMFPFRALEVVAPTLGHPIATDPS
jgi:hypothetical protein